MEGRPGRCGAGGPDGSLAVQATGSAACAARLALPATAASSGNGASSSMINDRFFAPAGQHRGLCSAVKQSSPQWKAQDTHSDPQQNNSASAQSATALCLLTQLKLDPSRPQYKYNLIYLTSAD